MYVQHSRLAKDVLFHATKATFMQQLQIKQKANEFERKRKIDYSYLAVLVLILLSKLQSQSLTTSGASYSAGCMKFTQLVH